MEDFNNIRNTYHFLAARKFLQKKGIIKNLDADNKAILEQILKTDIDTEDDQINQGLLAILEIMFGSKQKVQTALKKELASADGKSKVKIKNLLKIIDKAIKSEVKNSIVKIASPIESISSEISIFQEIEMRKYVNYGEFVFYKSLDKNYSSPVTDTSNVGEFGKLDRQQLVNMFDKKSFYNLSNEQRLQLCQAVVNEYCKSKGVASCEVKLGELPISDKKVCYGEFLPARSTILLNSKVFEMVDDLKYSKNEFLPLQILLTMVHEAQHRVQIENLDQINKSRKDELVSQCITNPKPTHSFKDYLSSIDELDARESAMQYIKEQLPQQDSDTLIKFFNTKITEEKNNGKKAVDEDIKNMFPLLYKQKVLLSGCNLESAKRNFLITMREKYFNQEISLSHTF